MNARVDLDVMAAVDVEQALLGGLLLDNRGFDGISDRLQPEHFAVELHRLVYAEIARQLGHGKPVDILTVATALGTLTNLEEMDSLARYVPGTTSMARYADILVERHQSRALMRVSGEIIDLARRHDLDIAERVETAQSQLFQITAGMPCDEWVGTHEGMLEHTKVLEARAEGLITAMPTGLVELDETLNGGLARGALVFVAGRPGMGKTALALTIALHMATERPVAMLSMEMSHGEIRDRQVAMLGRVSLSSVLCPNKGSGLDWKRVVDGTERAKNLQFYVSDQGGLNIRQVRAKARNIKRLRGLDVLIVDYIGLMAGLDSKQPRAYQIEEISRGLKALAKELNIAVLCLAQLNRDVEKRVDQTPVPSDLRDSGAIEQDADVILFIYRPKQANPDLGHEWSDYAKLRIAKARQGSSGDVNLTYISEQVRFDRWRGLPPMPSRSRGRDL